MKNVLAFDDIESLFENQRLASQMRFIVEVDKIKNILRRTILTDGSRRENDAEHSWHLALMAQLLEEYTKEPFSMERVLKMVIIHDLVEVYAGDTFAFDVSGNANKEEREKKAADKLFSILPKEQGDEIRLLWQEFDRMDTNDSKYAASLDRLQPFLHNALTNGHTWDLAKVKKSQVIERMQVAIDNLPAIKPFILNVIEKYVKEGHIQED